MKTFSERCDITVIGAGLAGISAAVSAAREGATVRLVEARSCIGGRIGSEIRFPLNDINSSNYAYIRETGILDEILFHVSRNNTEGNYCGQNRALTNWIHFEKRLKLFLETQLIDVKKNSARDKIDSVSTISNKNRGRVLFRSKYYIDCSGTGILSQLADAPGETGLEQSEFSKSTASGTRLIQRAATTMEVGLHEYPVPFYCPEWVSLKWEDNHPSAKIDLLESLTKGIEGIHNVEWLGDSKNTYNLNSSELIWSAWDYLKNRSPIVDKAKKMVVNNFSPIIRNSDGFRGFGEYILKTDDLESGNEFYDSVAMGRSPLDASDSLICSSRGKIALPHPFDIPLRCLVSKKIKNLFFAGENASATSRVSASLRHPPTASQMGESVGVCAAVCVNNKRLPRTILKPGNVEVVRKKLARLNHTCGRSPVEDLDNLIASSNVVSSSNLNTFITGTIDDLIEESPKSGLVQFPVSSDVIDEIQIFVGAVEESCFTFRLLEGASNGSTIAGSCLESGTVSVPEGKPCWRRIAINAKVQKKGWHFLEITNTGGVFFYFRKYSPVGLLFHDSLRENKSGLINPYSQYAPRSSDNFDFPNSVAIEVFPKQLVYEAENVKNGKARPGHMPNLWISEETDFRFPEFLEFHWDEAVDLSSIEIVWDSNLEFLFPSRPTTQSNIKISSLVTDYKIYFMNDVGHWEELIEVKGNQSGYSIHEFESINTRGIEIEILATGGLPRVQVYEVRAYS